MNLIESIITKNFKEANRILEVRIHDLMEQKLLELRKSFAARFFNEDSHDSHDSHDSYMIEDTQVLDEKARFRIVRARIRNGKVQRRKRVSNIKGYTFRNNKMIRMSPTERRHRRMGQRRGKIKRRAERSRIRIHMKRALRKRKSLGLH